VKKMSNSRWQPRNVCDGSKKFNNENSGEFAAQPEFAWCFKLFAAGLFWIRFSLLFVIAYVF